MSNGTFIKKKVYFTQVSNNYLEDVADETKIASPTSFYIYTLIQRYITIEDFTLTKNFLMKKSGLKEKTFEKYFKQIKDGGYLKTYQYPNEKGTFTTEYEILDIADLNTPSHIIYNSKGEIIQKHMPKGSEKEFKNNKKEVKKVSKKVSKKDFLKTSSTQANKPVPEGSEKKVSASPFFGGAEIEGGRKVGELNNTILNNTNINNTNIYQSIYNKTYCSLEKKEILDRKIEDLAEYMPGSFSRWDYRKFLNASCGDVELIKYTYDSVLEHMKNEDSKPIKNMVLYLIKAIEKELKTLVKNN